MTSPDVLRLRRREQELLENNTALVEKNRALQAELDALRRVVTVDKFGSSTLRVDTRNADVVRFFGVAGQEVARLPHVPKDEVVRLRVKLILEETLELIEACFHTSDFHFDACRERLFDVVNYALVDVGLTDFADATVDLDYVVEGARIAFGIDGVPLWNAVHEANLAKLDGPRRADGKLEKPPGWQPPDIRGELIRQGWRP